jgi:hypothetical protein
VGVAVSVGIRVMVGVTVIVGVKVGSDGAVNSGANVSVGGSGVGVGACEGSVQAASIIMNRAKTANFQRFI